MLKFECEFPRFINQQTNHWNGTRTTCNSNLPIKRKNACLLFEILILSSDFDIIMHVIITVLNK